MKLLITGGHVITMDPVIGNGRFDILIENDLIVEVGPQVLAHDAQRLDATGCIVIPGLINAHMHTWQTALRGVTANWTLPTYFRSVHAGLATLFNPDDLFIGTLVGALNQLNLGTTTLGDWCHNNPTPEHTDRAIDGLLESGIRAVYFHGSPKPDPKPGQKHFSEIPHPRSEIERLLKDRFTRRDALVTLGMAILGPHYSTYEVSEHDFELAAEYGLIASMHCAGLEPKTPDGWERLAERGLLGPSTNIVHGNNLSEAQLRMMIGRGVTFSVAPETEMTQGHGHPITGRLRDVGGAPSLGVDLESAIAGDMFTVARVALASQRALDNAQARTDSGQLPAHSTISTSEALSWITIRGAEALGLQDRVGSLTPGKQADIVLIRADGISMRPVHDPVASVLMQGSAANVDTVLVAGAIRKRAGKLLYPHLEQRLDELDASGRRISDRFAELAPA
ncbi:amidohydrolase family protein [Burkholderia pyrrocinia]|uniref:amidohydrolase family protein n=1 Tax=Burkholderia pyrrocinia TaxID=60550 RepID=UPI001575AF0A|nr:amidohydrolase family protein [Burkholderia pyrrocinia]NTX26955.1 amidohydrolase family protein [Burkholderia pyrrocinia]QVN20354.1 amidohydrolase family protein [Burkholderia pyrrocinia]